MMSRSDVIDIYAELARPGGQNDPDMPEVGNGGVAKDEYTVHFSITFLGLVINCYCRLPFSLAVMEIEYQKLLSFPSKGTISASYWFGCLRLTRNICLRKEILALAILEGLALNELVYECFTSCWKITSNASDAITRTERIVVALSGMMTGSSVTGGHSCNCNLMLSL
ncbi:hypothetical protein Ddye_009404 [Dipteronia dyeriana]|uniref:Uncharacterized protein n=1 Tax=Dipteronia dyeriana TaxID=168575 RepID=A0AAE0CM79_9ROSI|nr:hypothetical protein Ddye_009404 [Dipteronia dyeriana]